MPTALPCRSILMAQRLPVSERIARVQALRADLPKVKFQTKDIDAYKRAGRQ